MSEPNPYESPKSNPFAESRGEPASDADLRRRVEELEKKLASSWFVSRGFWGRILAVWGYFLLGYFIIAVVVWGIMGLIFLLSEAASF